MVDSQHIKLPIVHEQNLPSDQQVCFEVSVPFPQALIFTLEQLSFKHQSVDDNKQPKTIDALCQIIAYWPDNSIQWVKLTYQYVNQGQWYLNINKKQPASDNQSQQSIIENTETVKQYLFKGGDNSLKLDVENNLLEITDNQGQVILSLSAQDLLLTDSTGQTLQPDFNSASITQQNNLKPDASSAITTTINGQFLDTSVQFQLIAEWLVPFDLVKFSLQIHNTNRAIHQGGKWDLGDPGSFYFKALNLDLHTAQKSFKSHNTLIDLENKQTVSADNIVCEQFSSGGENWQSPVHVNHNNTVDIHQNGYLLNDGQKQQTGLRCQPVLNLKNNLAVCLNQFWQNFPKSISVKHNIVALGLFPANHTAYELQGGEKKNHHFGVSLNATNNNLSTSQKVNRSKVTWDWIKQCDLYPFFEKEQEKLGSLQTIINLGLDGNLGFLAKRETLDEYGWRNFGELYADHETVGYQGNDIFVSHYNNQYDPIYGFLRQYLTTGNNQWFELADDLAKHVKDIDIYHTKLDKNEYNGGMFWHTDHYLQAFTSSHRSYSKHQSSNAYQDHAGGGGPGGQHCYTTGLYLHYCMTGQQSSKEAVLTLTDWITYVYEGSGTCLELLLAFKKRNLAGYKNHFTGQYPLDRGNANYINALLDSFELTHQTSYLAKVENILSNTAHPNEDLNLRDLPDVEKNWFYTVYLQALCKYLLVKQANNSMDDNFYFNRDCLLNFADWMLKNERPYLEKPEILEYPNDTWTAQDLRKAYILAAAAYFSPRDGLKYMQKAEFFESYVSDKLSSSDTKSYTRILVLLMQNQGAISFFKSRALDMIFADRKDWPSSTFQQTSVYKGLVKVMFKRIIKFSPTKEFNWLKKRFE